MSQKPEKIESTPELEHVAALALNGLISNPAIVSGWNELSDKNLKNLADYAIASAYFLQEQLHKERSKG